MCTGQMTEYTLRGWLRDPMIRLVMASDGVTEHDMIALVRRVATATASRPQLLPRTGDMRVVEEHRAW